MLACVPSEPGDPSGSDDLDFCNFQEWIGYDKANPGKPHHGVAGTGSGCRRAAEFFSQVAGTKICSVLYQGEALALNDLVDGQIQIVFGNLPMMIPRIKSKRLRGIAVTSAKRCYPVPEIPAAGETVTGYDAAGWQGVLAPKALPNDIVARRNNEINRILQVPGTRECLAADGMDAAGGSPQRFKEFLKCEIAKWRKRGKVAGIKPES